MKNKSRKSDSFLEKHGPQISIAGYIILSLLTLYIVFGNFDFIGEEIRTNQLGFPGTAVKIPVYEMREFPSDKLALSELRRSALEVNGFKVDNYKLSSLTFDNLGYDCTWPQKEKLIAAEVINQPRKSESPFAQGIANPLLLLSPRFISLGNPEGSPVVLDPELTEIKYNPDTHEITAIYKLDAANTKFAVMTFNAFDLGFRSVRFNKERSLESESVSESKIMSTFSIFACNNDLPPDSEHQPTNNLIMTSSVGPITTKGLPAKLVFDLWRLDRGDIKELDKTPSDLSFVIKFEPVR